MPQFSAYFVFTSVLLKKGQQVLECCQALLSLQVEKEKDFFFWWRRKGAGIQTREAEGGDLRPFLIVSVLSYFQLLQLTSADALLLSREYAWAVNNADTLQHLVRQLRTQESAGKEGKKNKNQNISMSSSSHVYRPLPSLCISF